MNLFPKNVQIQPSGYIEDPETEALKIKGSYLFDFVKGEFVKGPDRKILKVKASLDRKSVVQGKSVDLGGRRIIKKKK